MATVATTESVGSKVWMRPLVRITSAASRPDDGCG
jgi:hypothetical protein